MNRISHICTLAVLLVFFWAVPASAYTITKMGVDPVGDFVVEPAKMEIFADPGATVERSISIVNRSEETVKFRLELEDFVGAEDGSVAVRLLGNDTSPYSFKTGIVPEINEFTLAFGERITIPVTITVPVGQAPGGYYTSVIVSNAPHKEDDTSGGAKVVSRIAQLLFVRVNGAVAEEGSMKDFRMSPPKTLYASGPFTFEVLFENKGNVHLAPYGTITVKNIFGKSVGTIPVDAYYSMPQSLRYRQVTWDKTSLFGYYTADIALSKGYKQGEDQVDLASISFWVIPWTTALLVIGIIAVLAFLISYIRRNFVFKRKEDA